MTIDPSALPSGTGCASGDAGRRVVGASAPLRDVCHIGCCDDSLAKHASAHWRASGHPIIRSFEPGEDWFWNYEVDEYCAGPELALPDSHRPTRVFRVREGASRVTGNSCSFVGVTGSG